MNGRERYLNTICFKDVDYMPASFWWDGEWVKYHNEEEIKELQKEMPDDYIHVSLPVKPYKVIDLKRVEDAWGCLWQTEVSGICGQVVKNPIDDYKKLSTYNPPLSYLDVPVDQVIADLEKTPEKAHKIGWMQLYERMRYLRPAEELYVDIALDDPNIYILRNKVMEYLHKELDIYLSLDVDIIVFSDDWGTQTSLQISPESWRRIFKPAYKELFDSIHAANKMVEFHSCGYIRDIIGDLVELKVEIVHCMAGIMNMEKLFHLYQGKICYCADFNRQRIPIESPEWVYHEVYRLYDSLGKNQKGGFFIVAEVAGATPLENVRAFIKAIKEIQGKQRP